MNFKRLILLIPVLLFLHSCADYKVNKSTSKKERHFYSSKGFALIYDDEIVESKLIKKKMKNDVFYVIHNFLKKNTPIKIVNPKNSKTIETKVNAKADYPKIFNIVISEQIATTLELDVENPYVEVIELKINKKFIAKEANTFEEEKNVAEKAPIDEIKMDDLSVKSYETTVNGDEKKFILVISDFYYLESAENLKKELLKKIKINNMSIKKINDHKYRLFVGPFENFNALKTTYISLNNLGFESLNVYRE